MASSSCFVHEARRHTVGAHLGTSRVIRTISWPGTAGSRLGFCRHHPMLLSGQTLGLRPAEFEKPIHGISTIVFGRVENACSSWKWFFLSQNYHTSVLEIYGFYTDRCLVCACKLAKVCYIRNMLWNGCREWGLTISIKNGVCRSKTAPKVSEKKSGWSEFIF